MTDYPPGSPGDLPDQGESPRLPTAVGAFQPIASNGRPDFKRAIPAALIAVVAFGFGSNLGGVSRNTAANLELFGWHVSVPAGGVVLLVLGLTLAFVVFGIVTARSVAKELARVSTNRAGVAAGSAIRLVCLIVCYLTIGLGVLAILKVDLGNLLVGGAVTGVVIGIAAQQTLGNFFAGLVLFFARPYVPGQRVKVHSGALGGPFVGVIVGASIMYTFIETADGLVSLPNSGLLGSAIGPPGEETPEDAPVPTDDVPDEVADRS